jgi:diguanylate cyclase (GGDEF)-like protein
MPRTTWTSRSLRFWVGLGMALAVLPLCLSAVGGYILLRHGVIAGFQDVASRQRYQIEPTQRLRLLLWEALVPVDDFVDEGEPQQPQAYRALRERIETAFAELDRGLRAEAEPLDLVHRAHEDWNAADALATEVLSARRAPGDEKIAAIMDRFHGQVESAVDRLGSVNDDLGTDLRADHDAALLSVERSEWLLGIAAFVSGLLILLGVFTIGRMMAVSVDRLVLGAARFAAGDRDHRIDVEVPPELRRVADEFNRMIVRIHRAEEALSNLARRDGLTGCLNRRAFDEALVESMARSQRLGEPVALLMIDIDHFKRVNDVHGHLVGDELLASVANTLVSDVRVFDKAFRIGGEEFAVLLSSVTAEDAVAIAERLREFISAKRILSDGQEISATVSIGVAVAARMSSTSAFVGAADAALYRAKNEGRNRVVLDGVRASPSGASTTEDVGQAVA